MSRVLKPSGSLIVNIKEGTTDGVRQMYVLDLVQAMVRGGWLWIDEFIWHKTSGIVGRFPNRLKDRYERLYHFALSTRPKFNPDAVRVPVRKRTMEDRRRSAKYNHDHVSTTGSGRSANIARILSKETALPSNVLVASHANNARDHPATFPSEIPDFFIRLLTDPGDLVYDPFMGSGTSAVVARDLGRKWVGSEISPAYCDLIRERMGPPRPPEGQGVLA